MEGKSAGRDQQYPARGEGTADVPLPKLPTRPSD